MPPQGNCGQSRYTGSRRLADYRARPPACLWNTQSLRNRTTGFQSRSSTSRRTRRSRHSWEVKTDGTYFLTNTLGGDHRLKFGLGWRQVTRSRPSRTTAAARAPRCSASGNNARQLRRRRLRAGGLGDRLSCRTRPCSIATSCCNNDWWTYNGYIQDCVQPRPGPHQRRPPLRLAAVEVPRRLRRRPTSCGRTCCRAQCEHGDRRSTRPPASRSSRSATGRRACRPPTTCSATARRRSTRAARTTTTTKITLANSLSGLFTQTALTWGPNQSSGACSTTAGAPCWNDANQRRPGPDQRAHRHADVRATPRSTRRRRASRRPATSSIRARKIAPHA